MVCCENYKSVASKWLVRLWNDCLPWGFLIWNESNSPLLMQAPEENIFFTDWNSSLLWAETDQSINVSHWRDWQNVHFVLVKRCEVCRSLHQCSKLKSRIPRKLCFSGIIVMKRPCSCDLLPTLPLIWTSFHRDWGKPGKIEILTGGLKHEVDRSSFISLTKAYPNAKLRYIYSHGCSISWKQTTVGAAKRI